MHPFFSRTNYFTWKQAIKYGDFTVGDVFTIDVTLVGRRDGFV